MSVLTIELAATADPSCSIFERALDALPDGVLLVTAARKIAYANTAFKRLWKIPGAILASQDDGEILQFAIEQLEDPAGFLGEVGGEEFLMAKRVRGNSEAKAVFESVRKSIAGMNLTHVGNPPHGIVTVSIGYGSFPSASEAETVFSRVDEALYKAKAQGRNRIVEALF